MAAEEAESHLEDQLENIAAGGDIRRRRNIAADAAARAISDSQRLGEASARAAQAAWRLQTYAEGQLEAISDFYDVDIPDRPSAARAALAGRWAVEGDEDARAPTGPVADAARVAATGPGWLARRRGRMSASVAPPQTSQASRTRSRTPRSHAWSELREAARRRLRPDPPLRQGGQHPRPSSSVHQTGGASSPRLPLLAASEDGPADTSAL